jgi:hypothetical protein
MDLGGTITTIMVVGCGLDRVEAKAVRSATKRHKRAQKLESADHAEGHRKRYDLDLS